MFCCSGQKRTNKSVSRNEMASNIIENKDNSNKEVRTFKSNQDNFDDKVVPQQKVFDDDPIIQNENPKIARCPVLKVHKTAFQLFLIAQQFIEEEEKQGSSQQQKKEIHIELQDESSVIMSYPKIKEESLIEEIEEQVEEDDDEDVDEDREMSEEEAKNAAIYRWAKESHDYCSDTCLEQIIARVQSFKPIQSKEESRFGMAHNKGGKVCKNKKLVRTLRAIGKDLIREIGRQILSGNLNLTTISFPIRAMIPKSALEKAILSSCLFPLYINRACLETNPIERMKLVICATLGNFYVNCSFLKPLNPILGETISGHYQDGTQCYAEQISHHPPISYILVIGPENSYRFYGYYNYEARAGVNSLSLKNKGKRFLQFKDGGLIKYNYANEEYSGSLWGSMKVECKGKLTFTDQLNEITASLEFDNVTWKASDYFQGDIKVKGKKSCKIYGSYMGFIEFAEVRYWDVNYIRPYECKINKPLLFMQSDASFRDDLRSLRRSKVKEAQQFKDQLEIVQRQDAKLRKERQPTQSK